MINNVDGGTDKTLPPSGNQHIMLHAIYSTRALPRNFGKMTFLRNWKKNISRSSLNLVTHSPNTAGVHGTLCGVWYCEPPGGYEGLSSNHLKVF